MSSTHALLARKVLDSIRGSSGKMPLRWFPLKAHHVASISSTNSPPAPSEFHSQLLHLIRNAKHRVHLASLYIGPAASSAATHEHELLDALTDLAANRPQVELKLLMDANRALRPVKTTTADKNTSSAEAVYKCIQARTASDSTPCALYLFNPSPSSMLPSPLNEVAGVFHIKCYIIDDNLILSGANLSQEYFTDRQDRYTWFTDGGGGLVDFYADLMKALCDYGSIYGEGHSAKNNFDRHGLMCTLSALMDGTKESDKSTVSTESNDSVVAYAVPTFQAPFLAMSNDVKATHELLSNAKNCSVQLASAYLNPTRPLLQDLSKFDKVELLTAGPTSHGFAPKQGLKRKGDWVPQIFQTISDKLARHYEVLLYSRPGWTFHAKGLWVHHGNHLVAAMVGSGNYGHRSWHRDIESNVVMVFPHETSLLQSRLQGEWTSLCQYASVSQRASPVPTNVLLSPVIIQASLPLIRRFF
jgi:CDP-diacylglycerol---glycerol-3-phosphate 3-phosphatidyltransferase